MSGPTASVIIVSRGRPDALLRCLKALEQLFFTEFEVVVVADPSGIGALTASGQAATLKAIEFDQANISAARNLGLTAAAGEIVAFIDDDAVCEPTWLGNLVAAFADPIVTAAGGFVRARNGISFQSTAQWVGRTGAQVQIAMADNQPRIFAPDAFRAVKTEGTNCAFRRDVLQAMGGFDPAFRFYLDETDLNMRLAKAGHRTAIVPLAQVHHGFAASAQRQASRMPTTLYDVGASQVVYLRKHAETHELEPVLNELRREQHMRLVRHMVAGNCEPRDISAVMQSLEDGIVDGRQRPIGALAPISPDAPPFLRWTRAGQFHGSHILAARSWSRRRVRADAVATVGNGNRVSLFLFSPTALYHRVMFSPQGYWEQRGGLFGKSDRSGPALQLSGFRKRLRREIDRVRHVRQFTG